MDDNIQGNLSTIILLIYIIISPYIESLGITQSLFMESCYAIIGLIIAIWSAYNPNTFEILGNGKKSNCECKLNNEESLYDEYETEIDDEGC